MNQKEILRRKIEYATPEELLFMLLNDTEKKFKEVIVLWEKNDAKGTVIASKIADNIMELMVTLNTEIGDEDTKKGLRTVKSLYGFILDELAIAALKKDTQKIKSSYEIFKNIKDIFETDKNAK